MLFNLAPLDLTPLYANESYGGVDASWLWEGKSQGFIGSNKTETSEIMREYVGTVNQIFEYGLGFQAMVERRWKGSEVVLFDVHRLVSCYFHEPLLRPPTPGPLLFLSFFPKLTHYNPVPLEGMTLGRRNKHS